MKDLLRFFVACMLLSATSYAGNYTWTGTTSSAWNVNTNWSPQAIPGSSDTITINTTNTSLVLTGKQTVKRLVMTNDTLNLGGDTLEITGSAGFNGGHIINGVCYPQATGLLSFAGTTFGAEVKAKGQIKLNGSTFNSTAYFEHIGSAAGTGSGGNTFNGTTTLKNAGTSTFRLAGSANDTFNGDVTVISAATSGSGSMQLSAGGSSYFNGNIVVNSTTVFGISFSSVGAGSSVLASGKTISIGGSGFVGTLLMRNFTQLGSTAQTLSFSGILNIMNSEFNGSLTSSSTNLLLTGNNFHGVCSFTKIGISSDYSAGGNHFYQDLTIQNNVTNTAIIRMASTNGDIYEGDVTLNTSTGFIQMAYADTSDFHGDISINNTKVNFNSGAGVLHITGTSAQSFQGTAGYSIGKIIVNNTSNGAISCNQPITIDSVLVLTQGLLSTDSTNILTLKASAVCNTGSSISFVDGPMKKIGNTAFEFPVGKNGRIMKIGISATTNAANQYIVEYFNSAQNLGTNVQAGITILSSNEYWKLTGGMSGQNYTVTLNWDLHSKGLHSNAFKIVAGWNGTTWVNKGVASIAGSSLSGSINSLIAGNENYYTIGGTNSATNLDSLNVFGRFGDFGLLSGESINTNDSIFVQGDIGAFNTVDNKILGDSTFQNSHFKVINGMSDFYDLLAQINSIPADSVLSLNNNFHTLVSGKYFLTGSDTIKGELFLEGDSIDKFILICDYDVVLTEKFKIRHKDVKPKNIILILNKKSTLSEDFFFRGVLFADQTLVNELPGGKFQLISPSSITVVNAVRHWSYSLNSLNRIALMPAYTCTTPSNACNLVKNPGFEVGSLPNFTGGILDYYCDCWSAERFVNGFCSIRVDNTTDYFDISGPGNASYTCTDGSSHLGIPFNHVGNLTNVRIPNTENYTHLLGREELEGELNSNFEAAPYLLSLWHSKINCGQLLSSGGFCLTAIGPISVSSNVGEPLGFVPFTISTNQLPGVWQQSIAIVDGFQLSNPNSYNRIGITGDYPGNLGQGLYIDDIELIKLFNNDPPAQASCGVVLPGVEINSSCISAYFQGPNPLLNFETNWSSNPPYTGPGFDQNGTSSLNFPLVDPIQTTVFTLNLVFTTSQNNTLFIQDYTYVVGPNSGTNNLACTISSNPAVLCTGQTATITASVTGGNQPYTYLWNNSVLTNPITVNSSGTYQVTVTDINGCTTTNTYQLTEAPCCSLAIALSSQIPCAPATTSSINVQLNNGTGPYAINWQQTAGGTASGSLTTSSTSFSLQGLKLGTYTVSVTDANGCTALNSVVVSTLASQQLLKLPALQLPVT